jgi:steroid delta-isomerase-like uncharacterized protein
MSVEQNKAVIRRIAEEIWNKGNLAIAAQIYPSNYVFHDPSGQDIKGTEGIKQAISMLRSAFPDLVFAINDMVAEGDKVAWRYTVTGTHKGEYMGIAPTGRKINISGIIISRCADGKEVEGWPSDTRLALYQQLGVTPPKG